MGQVEGTTQCFWHGQEQIDETCYVLCIECGHVWQTEEAFLADVNWHVVYLLNRSSEPGAALVPEATQGDAVTFCPLCLHDF